MTTLLELDDFDRKILRALQENADYSMADLGNLIGLSHTPCWRRLKRLEADGIIRGKVTLLDAEMLNLSVNVHARVTMKSYEAPALEAFELAVQEIPEITECYSTTGEHDYLLLIVVESVSCYDKLLKRILAELPNIAAIHSTVALRQVKYTTQLPL